VSDEIGERPRVRVRAVLARVAQPLLALAGVVLLGVMLSHLSRAELAAALRRVGPGGLWTLVLWVVGTLINALTLRALLPRGVPLLGLWHNRFISESYNGLLPLLGLGGEGLKVRFLVRYVTIERALTATVRERLIDAVVDFFYSAALVAWGALALPLQPAGRDASWAGAGLSLALGVLALVALATPLPSRLMARVGRWLGGDGAAATAELPVGAQLAAAAWNLGGRLIGVAEVPLLLYLLGHRAPLVEWFFIAGALSVVGTISWPIPGSIGAAEVGAVVVFQWLGLPAADGMAFALVRRARQIFTSSFGVALLAVERRRG
jgi:uncharacterized membrane protein YbhN (UPF0104 family)